MFAEVPCVSQVFYRNILLFKTCSWALVLLTTLCGIIQRLKFMPKGEIVRLWQYKLVLWLLKRENTCSCSLLQLPELPYLKLLCCSIWYTSICDAATANGMIIPVQQEGKYLMPYSSCLLSCLFIENGNTWELLVAIMIVRCIQCYPFTFSELYCSLSCCTLSTLTVEMWCELQEAPQIRKYQLYIIWPLAVAPFLIQVLQSRCS